MAKKKLPPKFDPFAAIPDWYYHVTPYDVWKNQVSKEGLIPRVEKRGIHADDPFQKRIYLFENPDTADDALDNWIVDWYPTVRWFAVLEIAIPPSIREVHDDPELAGSYFVTGRIPPEYIRLLQKVDAGEPE